MLMWQRGLPPPPTCYNEPFDRWRVEKITKVGQKMQLGPGGGGLAKEEEDENDGSL